MRQMGDYPLHMILSGCRFSRVKGFAQAEAEGSWQLVPRALSCSPGLARDVLSPGAGPLEERSVQTMQQAEQTLVSNEVYDVLQATATKLEGLAAYNKYERDGNSQLWQQLRQQDEQAIRQLLQQLERFAQEGKLRAQ